MRDPSTGASNQEDRLVTNVQRGSRKDREGFYKGFFRDVFKRSYANSSRQVVTVIATITTV